MSEQGDNTEKIDGLKSALKEKVAALPDDPGVYLMKNATEKIIYVGKAKNLKNRVRSYFTNENQHTPKTKVLVSEVHNFEIIITATEVEALLLERTLIKHHAPCYNILLRDDKEYPWIRVGFNEDWPRIEIVRRQKDDGAYYIGPFGSSRSLRILIDTAQRIFPLIRCSRHEFSSVRRPCNYYHMKMCLGPCHIPVDREHYVSIVKDALLFIQGKDHDLAKMIKQKMEEASAAQKYEQAASYRDQLDALREIAQNRQSAIVKNVKHADVLGVYQAGEKTSFHVLMVRGGRLIGSDSFIVESLVQSESEALQEFLSQYYENRSLPPEMILPFENTDVLQMIDTLKEALNTPVQVNVPQKGSKLSLLEIARKNAKYNLDESERLQKGKQTELQMVQKALGLELFPKRIECIDISNLQGSAIVASDVCFVDGKPAKELYRHYTINDVQNAPDDFESIREVVKRRLVRGERDQDLPDLLVIDGGKGQLSAAVGVMDEFPSLTLKIVSLAKNRDGQMNEEGFKIERVFFQDREDPYILVPGTPEYRILAHLRDEAHRFAISHHRKKRSKLAHASELEEVPGIGPSLRKKILETFNGIEGLKKASLDQIKNIKGLKESSALALYSKFRE